MIPESTKVQINNPQHRIWCVADQIHPPKTRGVAFKTFVPRRRVFRQTFVYTAGWLPHPPGAAFVIHPLTGVGEADIAALPARGQSVGDPARPSQDSSCGADFSGGTHLGLLPARQSLLAYFFYRTGLSRISAWRSILVQNPSPGFWPPRAGGSCGFSSFAPKHPGTFRATSFGGELNPGKRAFEALPRKRPRPLCRGLSLQPLAIHNLCSFAFENIPGRRYLQPDTWAGYLGIPPCSTRGWTFSGWFLKAVPRHGPVVTPFDAATQMFPADSGPWCSIAPKGRRWQRTVPADQPWGPFRPLAPSAELSQGSGGRA